MKIRLVGAMLFHAERQIWQSWHSRFAVLRKAPKNWQKVFLFHVPKWRSI